MILKFTVENFKSIKMPIVFDLQCSALKDSEGKANTKIVLNEDLSYKKITAIYGPNASGKSNFISALYTMANLVRDSSTITPEDRLVYDPFLFDGGTMANPTRFAIELYLNGVRYLYSFSYNDASIISEKLQYAPKNYTVLVFERKGNEYQFGSDEKILSPFVERTSANKLFLGTVSSFNYQPCVDVYRFFANDLIVDFQNRIYRTSAGQNLLNEISEKIIKDENFRFYSLSFLQAADLNISSLEPKPLAPSSPARDAFVKGKSDYSLMVGHRVSGEEHFLHLEEESDGTQSILFLSFFFYQAMLGEKVLLVDELDQSLHTMLLPFLVKVFANNCPQSQFIFATHDASIMRQSTLRRDEYYFAEKDDDVATSLFPLSDFSVRKNAKIEDEYLEGRFGAVPFIKDGFVQ